MDERAAKLNWKLDVKTAFESWSHVLEFVDCQLFDHMRRLEVSFRRRDHLDDKIFVCGVKREAHARINTLDGKQLRILGERAGAQALINSSRGRTDGR